VDSTVQYGLKPRGVTRALVEFVSLLTPPAKQFGGTAQIASFVGFYSCGEANKTLAKLDLAVK